MSTTSHSYIYHSDISTLCPECLKPLMGKRVIQSGSVFQECTCPKHGTFHEILEEDAKWWLHRHDYNKPGTRTLNETEFNNGCPFDCGICPNHQQHSCIGLIEITNACNLACPTCFAEASSSATKELSLATIEKIVDKFIVAEGGNAEIIQISGGEPTIHPEILKIIDMIASKKVNYILLNTNGLRMAEDKVFVKSLAPYLGKLEVYLQYDGVKGSTHKYFRGKDLRTVKQKAIVNLREIKIPVTLVAIGKSGVNEKELGKLVDFGIATHGVRGVTIQPLAHFGRNPKKKRSSTLTISETIRHITANSKEVMDPSGFIPLPCNVESVGINFLFRESGVFVPLVQKFDIKKSLNFIDNTFDFNAKTFKAKLKANVASGKLCQCLSFAQHFKEIFPESFWKLDTEKQRDYIDKNLFRVTIARFIDRYTFDTSAARKECVHTLLSDGRRIPFSIHNMFRDHYE